MGGGSWRRGESSTSNSQRLSHVQLPIRHVLSRPAVGVARSVWESGVSSWELETRRVVNSQRICLAGQLHAGSLSTHLHDTQRHRGTENRASRDCPTLITNRGDAKVRGDHGDSQPKIDSIAEADLPCGASATGRRATRGPDRAPPELKALSAWPCFRIPARLDSDAGPRAGVTRGAPRSRRSLRFM